MGPLTYKAVRHQPQQPRRNPDKTRLMANSAAYWERHERPNTMTDRPSSEVPVYLDPALKTIGRRLRKARLKYGFGRKYVSGMAGISEDYLQVIEDGAICTDATLRKICNVCLISYADVTKGLEKV